MAKFYKPFFLFYGGVHLLAGLLIAFFPPILSDVLYSPLKTWTAMFLGFICGLIGLAFFGTAFVESQQTKRLVVKLAIAGNVLNYLAHLINVLRYIESPYMIFWGAFGIFPMLIFLVGIHLGLQTDDSNLKT